MTEIESLGIRARKYLDSATLLIHADDYESAVSRAYYAMFFTVQAALLHKELSASTHKGVISLFGEHFIKTGIFPKSVARALSVAFEKRQLGDYESCLIIERDEAEAVLESARDTVALISAWISDQKPGQTAE